MEFDGDEDNMETQSFKPYQGASTLTDVDGLIGKMLNVGK